MTFFEIKRENTLCYGNKNITVRGLDFVYFHELARGEGKQKNSTHFRECCV